MRMLRFFSFVVLVTLFTSPSSYAQLGGKESGPVNPKVRNYNDLAKAGNVNVIDFDCSFKNLVNQNLTAAGDFCKARDNKLLDYVSYFVAFDYQNIAYRSNDFILNLAYFIDSKGKNAVKAMIEHYTQKGDDGVKSKIFDNATPTSFVANNENTLRFFISKKDLFLRDNIYPSYRLTGLIHPEKPSKFLADYRLKYSVYPFVMSMVYDDKWVSLMTGAPLYTEAEKTMENEQEKFFNYFNTLSKFVTDQSVEYYDFASAKDITLPASVYPFLYEKQIKEMAANKTDKLVATARADGEGYIFDYLPSYKLEKVEIVVIKSDNKTETVLKSFKPSEFGEVYLNNDDNAGLVFDTFKLKNARYLIRFTHTAQAPKYDDAGSRRTEGSGLGYIYSSLASKIVTNLNVAVEYNLDELPMQCLEDSNIVDILNGLELTKEEIEESLAKFKDMKKDTEKCNQIQLQVMRMIADKKK